jgi:hypothetical protein
MFAAMPLDHRTLTEIPAWTAVTAQACANLRTKDGDQNELKFRRHRGFCNIETYIRQYG